MPDNEDEKVDTKVANGGLDYEPEKWNDGDTTEDLINGNIDQLANPGEVQYSTNCYAYAFNFQYNPLTGKRFDTNGYFNGTPDFAMQPGMFSGGGKYRNSSDIVDLVTKDADKLGYKLNLLILMTLLKKEIGKLHLFTQLM